jgi:hypothetical protein
MLLQISGAREMVGVCVRLKNPLNLKAAVSYVGEKPSAWTVVVRPDLKSKSNTGSTMAANRVALSTMT